MIVKTENGTKEASLLSVTKENYICPDNEKHLYHAVIEVRKFNSESGARLSKPRLQKFDRKFFNTFGLHNLRQQGYTVTIVHDPLEWEAEHAAEEAARRAQAKLKAAEEAAKAAEEAKKAEEAAKAAEREALKEELRKELLAELNASKGESVESEEKPKKGISKSNKK